MKTQHSQKKLKVYKQEQASALDSALFIYL